MRSRPMSRCCARTRPQRHSLAVVKADAYGHGLVPSARAAISGGADWLGTALLSEAAELRQQGITVPVLAWLWSPGDDDLVACVRDEIDVTASSLWQLEALTAASHATRGPGARPVEGRHRVGPQRRHRGGLAGSSWSAPPSCEANGTMQVTGVWSHFAVADAPSSATNAAQLVAFDAALEVVAAAGLTPRVRHIANSAATLASPQAHYDLVRPGIAIYGVSPGRGAWTTRSSTDSLRR